jgi:hypothetical protein
MESTGDFNTTAQKESHMFRQDAMACSLALLSLGVTGCSSQPVAPSSLPSGLAPTASLSTLSPASGATSVPASRTARGGRPASPGIVYVTGQGLYYDTFVAAESLPMHGRFQKLENGTTAYGPGDPGYLGGRWWVDDGDGIQGPEDSFFLCPLLGPGRETP